MGPVQHVSLRERLILTFFILFLSVTVVSNGLNTYGPYRWMKRDNFDKIMELMDAVTVDNCHTKPEAELRLPRDSIHQTPAFNTIPVNQWYQNRTRMMYMHSLALNRAHFYSYILQRLNESMVDFPLLPGFLYYYFSTSADVSSGISVINGSAVLMDTNCTYANWLTDLDFNKTLPLFGPKAMHLDDWMDEMNWQREPTNFTIEVVDYGAGHNNNYTAPWYRTNPYVTETNWLPDDRYYLASKHQYDTEIQFADINGNMDGRAEGKGYFGPTSPGEKESNIPVKFTSPYFDCGKTNKWIVTAVAPIVDFMYRYSRETRLRGGQIVGLVTMDIDYLRLDFNPCPAGVGNENHFLAGTARCKPTTTCEPLPGFGFRRGGYQCHCAPLHRLPYTQNGPFQGVDIEQATEEEYNNGFDCIKSNWLYVLPIDGTITENLERRRRSLPGNGTETEDDRPQYLSWWDALKNGAKRVVGGAVKAYKSFKKEWLEPRRHRLVARKVLPELEVEQPTPSSSVVPSSGDHRDDEQTLRFKPLVPVPDVSTVNNVSQSRPRVVSRKRRALEYRGKETYFDPVQFERVRKVLMQMENITGENCVNKAPGELEFPGEVGYGADVRFEMQARTALRLAHFLSAFYQNDIAGEIYGNLKVDQPLNKHQLFGEVIANVIGDPEISASGIYFDNQMFVNEKGERWPRFAPYAYRPGKSTHSFKALDMSLKKYRDYTEKAWFRTLKERWASNTYGLERFVNKPWKRKDVQGTQVERFDNYPLYYRAPRLDDGFWTQPYFDCDGTLKEWFLTYSAPFFGLPRQDAGLRFMGVVTVTVPLRKLDVNQCPGSFYTANFFKNTARCDYRTTYCIPWARRGFTWGNYRCECRQGFELQIQEGNWFFEGQTMESEYMKKLEGKPNRFDLLRCRQASGMMYKSNVLIILVALLSFVAAHYSGSGHLFW